MTVVDFNKAKNEKTSGHVNKIPDLQFGKMYVYEDSVGTEAIVFIVDTDTCASMVNFSNGRAVKTVEYDSKNSKEQTLDILKNSLMGNIKGVIQFMQ